MQLENLGQVIVTVGTHAREETRIPGGKQKQTIWNILRMAPRIKMIVN